jgi:type 1 glutamine amidotransferase
MLSFLLCSGCRDHSCKILVIAGGHAYDTVEFIEVFRSIGAFEFDTMMQPAANKFLTTQAAANYDAFVFYDSWDSVSEDEKQAYLHLLDEGKGMVFLHHALVSYQHWPEFESIVGGKYRLHLPDDDTINLSRYRHDIDLEIEILDPEHPVTEGMHDFIIHDEGYMNISRDESVTPLLRTDHPQCTDIVGWAHRYDNSRIVYLLLGHDAAALGNANFRQLVANAIRWTAGKD